MSRALAIGSPAVHWDDVMLYMHSIYGDSPEHLPHYSDLSLLVAIILSATSRDVIVIKYCSDFLRNIVDTDYAFSLSIDDISNLINKVYLHKRKSVSIYHLFSKVRANPNMLYSYDELLLIYGVGIKTVHVFLNQVTDSSLIGVDTHVYRAISKITGVSFKSRDDVYRYCITNIPFKWHKYVNKYLVYLSKRNFVDLPSTSSFR